MTARELNRDQLDELKMAYVSEMTDSPSYLELAESVRVPDEVIFQHYDGMHFVPDDFWCSIGA